MLDAAMEAEAVVQNASSEPSGTLKVATPINMDSQFSSQLLSGYLLKYPKMNVEVHRDSDNVALIEEGYDCAIYMGKVPDSNNVIRGLGKDEIILCASPKYLSTFGMPQSFDELVGHIGLQYDLLRFNQDDKKGGADIPLPARYSANDPILVKRLATDGVGICYLPKSGVLECLEEGSLVQVLPDWSVEVELSLVYTGKKNLSPKLDSFISFLLDAFENGEVPWDY